MYQLESVRCSVPVPGACVPDGERFPCLTFLFMDPLGRGPLIPSFERPLYVQNRLARTVTTYLIAARQADAFLRGRGTSLEGATRADLEAFMADLLSRRMASTAATYTRSSRSSIGFEPACIPQLVAERDSARTVSCS